MRIRLTKSGFEILKPDTQTPTIVKRAKEVQDNAEQRKANAMTPKDMKQKVKTTERRIVTRKDFNTEQEYLRFVAQAMKPYLEWLHKNGKL